MLMRAIARGDVQTLSESLRRKLTLGGKFPLRSGESNLRQRRAGPMLYQLSCIPTPSSLNEA